MLFNSLAFLIFFPIVVMLYFSLPQRYRWTLLLVASYYFYMSWKPEYIVLIMASTIIDYTVARRLGVVTDARKRKWLLALSVVSNLGLLFAFKYFNFFSASFSQAMMSFGIPFTPLALKVLLPVGISFYTFQTMSYTIDVYRGKIKPEKHLGIFAVYVSFFPQLVAGPIERAKHLLPQFYEKHILSHKNVIDGLKLMLWGFFKKVVIADRVAIYVNEVYNALPQATSTQIIVATLFFAVQIYCDFSGYSDIAIGSAQVLGFDLMDNFKRPYFAKSIGEFWHRWHISLSTWFKDYVYIPLGGNRVSQVRHYLNLFIVFVVSGLWHGANWTFLIWGALHGVYQVFGVATKRLRERFNQWIGLVRLPRLYGVIQILITFLLVNFAWIFFRANNVTDAFYIVKHLFADMSLSQVTLSLGRVGFAIALVSIGLMELVHLIQEHRGMRHFLSARPVWVQWALPLALIMFILLFGMFEQPSQFIYFQF